MLRTQESGDAKIWKPNPDPERCIFKLESVGDIAERDGGFVFKALAQAYGKVNDRLMMFSPGSGAKTIAERVPTGAVKIHDGHPWSPSSKTIVGKVLSATESDDGVTYEGFLSSTEQDLAVKIAEGVVDQNSLEVFVLREDEVEVDLEEVPVIARRWARISPSGKAVVRLVQEWMWLAIGVLGSSSQGIRSVIDVPRLVPYQDLALASRSTSWDPVGAADRVASWSGADRFGAGARWARYSKAFLARGSGVFQYQIADVVDGELRVVPEALEAAAADLESLAEDDPLTAVAVARTIGRYEQRLLTESPLLSHPEKGTADRTQMRSAGAPEDPPAAELSSRQDAAPTSDAAAGPAEPPTDKARSHAERSPELFSSDDDRDKALRELLTESCSI